MPAPGLPPVAVAKMPAPNKQARPIVTKMSDKAADEVDVAYHRATRNSIVSLDICPRLAGSRPLSSIFPASTPFAKSHSQSSAHHFSHVVIRIGAFASNPMAFGDSGVEFA